MGRNKNIHSSGGAGQNSKMSKSKGAYERSRMGSNEKFKFKKSKRAHTKKEKVGHAESRMEDLAIPLIQVGLALLFFAIVVWILKSYVL